MKKTVNAEMPSYRNKIVKQIKRKNKKQNSQTDVIKRRVIVVPWANLAEFREVRDWLHSEKSDHSTRHFALNRLTVWNLRRSTLCPAAICATYELLNVQLKDEEDCTNKLTAIELQSLYAFAITRFFNFMSSTVQQHKMRSMYETARELRINSSIVDVRHLCAHGQVLPDLATLRKFTNYCMTWLRDYFWLPSLDSMQDASAMEIQGHVVQKFKHKIETLCIVYDVALEAHMKQIKDLKTANRHFPAKRYKCLKDFYKRKTYKSMREVLDDVVKQIVIAMKSETIVKDVKSIVLWALLKMKYFYQIHDELVAKKIGTLEKILKSTQNLFQMLAKQNYIEDFFRILMNSIENRQKYHFMSIDGAAFWALQLVKSFAAYHKCLLIQQDEAESNPTYKEISFATLNLEKIPHKIRSFFTYAGINIKQTLIFGKSHGLWLFPRKYFENHMRNITEKTAPILRILTSILDPTISDEEEKQLNDYILARFPNLIKNSNEFSDSVESIYTVNDVEQHAKNATLNFKSIVEPINMENTEFSKTKFGVFTLGSEDINWSAIPLGISPEEYNSTL